MMRRTSLLRNVALRLILMASGGLLLLYGIHWRFGNRINSWRAAGPSQKLSKRSVIAEQQKRLDCLKPYCERHPSPHTVVQNPDMIFVDDKHKVMYCALPKSGSSAWKWNLMALNTKNVSSVEMGVIVHSHEYLAKHGIRVLSSYNESQISTRIREYYKFFFVRHPLTRLVSGYKNKFAIDKSTVFMREYGAEILKYDGKNVTKERPEHYHITFRQFLSYLFSNNSNTKLRHDKHFDNYAHLCSPCAMKYNFIGKQETFDEDSRYLFSHIFNKTVKAPAAPFPTYSDKEASSKAFLKVPRYLQTSAKEQYAGELEMFGYDTTGYT